MFADQMEVTIRHHALEAGCFVVNATGWLSDAQIGAVTPDAKLQKALRGGCCTAIVSPEGQHVAPPLTEGEGILVADLDLSLIVKRKRMMDSVGHYARPELLGLVLDDRPTAPMTTVSSGYPPPSTATTTPSPETGPMTRTATPTMPAEILINELQSFGVRLVDPGAGAASRRGGAGPSDHKALTIDGRTVMVPVHTAAAFASPYLVERPGPDGLSVIQRDGAEVARVSFPIGPRFYRLQTLDGVPYPQIAVLHGRDVLATTVLQTCMRYQSRTKTCRFCAIGQSLAAGRTIARKTPEQLAEVARAAVLLDGVQHMVMTTGTPATPDRGARILCESAFAVKAAVDLPIQAQGEPPDEDAWFARLKASGVDSLGMHLEVVTPELRARVMPGKAAVGVDECLRAFAAAVPVFGRGQVSTYILAGLGDTEAAILAMAERLIGLGVYPFVVPFVPISGTPLEDHPAPSAAFMHAVLRPLGTMLGRAGMLSSSIKAGCGRCGACSALSAYERPAPVAGAFVR